MLEEHIEFLSQLVKDEVSEERHSQNVQQFAALYDAEIRTVFSQPDILPDKNKDINIEGEVTNLNKSLSTTFDAIAARVAYDILNASNINAAAKIYVYYVDMAYYAKTMLHNDHLATAILAGIKTLHVDAIFEPSKISYNTLPLTTQNYLKELSNKQQSKLVKANYLPYIGSLSGKLAHDGNADEIYNELLEIKKANCSVLAPNKSIKLLLEQNIEDFGTNAEEDAYNKNIALRKIILDTVNKKSGNRRQRSNSSIRMNRLSRHRQLKVSM